MPEITLDGKRVWYSSGGADWQAGRPLVVMIHGAGGDHSVWALQSRALAQHGYNVAALDLPGHGDSEDVETLQTVEDHADWVNGFIAAVGETRAAVAGHSMGACIALTLAARDSERVSALALLGAAAEMPVNPGLLSDTRDRPAQAAAFITAYGHGRPAHFGLSALPGIWMLGAGLALLDRCPAGVLHRDFAACAEWKGAPLAPRVKCPTLVLAGAGDRMVPAKAGRALAAAIPGARLEVLPLTGHMMMGEAPGPVTRALRDFLAEMSGAARPAGLSSAGQ